MVSKAMGLLINEGDNIIKVLFLLFSVILLCGCIESDSDSQHDMLTESTEEYIKLPDEGEIEDEIALDAKQRHMESVYRYEKMVKNRQVNDGNHQEKVVIDSPNSISYKHFYNNVQF